MTITFNKKFRVFPKGYVAQFNDDKVVLVGDNGSGKSTLMLILLTKLFMDNGVMSFFIENNLGVFIKAIEKEEIIVQLDKTPLPIIRDEEHFNNDYMVRNQMGGIAQLVRRFNGTSQSSGEKKLDEVLDNIAIQHHGYEDKTVKDGNILILDEPDANLSLASLLRLRKELKDVEQSFIIYHNPYIISKEKEVYYLRLGSRGVACRVKKIKGEDYIKEVEKQFLK